MAATTDRPSSTIDNPHASQGDQLKKALTATLCDGLFSYADNDNATRIINQCLTLCGGSQVVLSQVIQTKFVASHTPFYWVVANPPKEEHSGSQNAIPPLLDQFFELCDGDLLEETQRDLVDGLFIASSDVLYQLISSKLTFVGSPSASSFFQGQSDQPVYTVSLSQSFDFELAFNIPRFYDRILIDGEISHQFIANGSLWRFSAVASPASPARQAKSVWYFQLMETHSKNNYELPTPLYEYRRTIRVDIASGSWEVAKTHWPTVPVPNKTEIDLKPHPLSKLLAHPFIQQENRALSGTIRLVTRPELIKHPI